jgi:hypothetical protein
LIEPPPFACCGFHASAVSKFSPTIQTSFLLGTPRKTRSHRIGASGSSLRISRDLQK